MTSSLRYNTVRSGLAGNPGPRSSPQLVDWTQCRMTANFNLREKSMLLRYVSEWDPRLAAHTKGGYIRGEVSEVPSEASRMVLTTVPCEDNVRMMEAELGDKVGDVGQVHPLLLHVVRLGHGKRENQLEPVPTFYHWKQEFHIDRDTNIRILNRVSDLDFDERTGEVRDVPTDPSDDRTIVTRITERNTIVFGGNKGEINMIALQPKQDNRRAQKGEATITNVLADRLRDKSKDTRQIVERLFVKKNKSNLKIFRIKVDFYSETNLLLGSCISDAIRDTGNRVCGAMDIHDVSLQKSCTAGGRKVIMVSEFSLADDVIPIFRVFDSDGQNCPEDEQRINQPHEKKFTWRKESILFMTPAQNIDVINDLANHNKRLHLLFKRKSDDYESPSSFEFQYVPHPEERRFGLCIICDHNVDTAGEQRVVELPKARQSGPRNRRRRIE